MTCRRVAVFIDYRDALWSAQLLFGRDGSRNLDPRALAQAVCDELKAAEMSTSPSVRLAEVRVYLSEPRKSPGKARHARRCGLWRAHGQRLGVPITILDPPVNQFDEPKEVHTQLTVDLLLWADSVTSGRSASEVAVLFSTDRECRPAVREASARLATISGSRVDLAGWAGQECSQLDVQWITDLSAAPSVHLVSLQDYEKRENKRRPRAKGQP